MMTRRRPIHRRAFSLVELTVSMAVMTVLMGGLASAIVIASRAIPDDQSPISATLEGSDIAEQIAGELFCAQSFSQRTATAVTFTVADRTGDSVAETIRYAWTGAPGDPLTRQYNGGTIINLVDSTEELVLTYKTRTVSTTTTTTTTGQSSEIDLASFDSWSGVFPTDDAPSSSRWRAEYCQISAPGGVTSMNITRVQLMMRENIINPAATVSVGIHRPASPGDPEPQATPLGTPAVRLTSSLGTSYVWTDFTFSDVVVDPTDPELVIVLKGTALGTANVRSYYWKFAPADTTNLIWTTDSGASWDPRASAQDDYDMPFHIYGTYETETTQDVTTDQYFLHSVGIRLRAGPDTSTRVETSVPVLNEPEVPSA